MLSSARTVAAPVDLWMLELKSHVHKDRHQKHRRCIKTPNHPSAVPDVSFSMHGTQVMFAGEIGVGKSALVATLANALQDGPRSGGVAGGSARAMDESHTLALAFPPTAARNHRPLTVLCTLVDSSPTAGEGGAPDGGDLARVKEYVETCIERCELS